MPNLFDEEVGTVIAPEDRLSAHRDIRFLRSRRIVADHWDVMEPITITELQKRTKLNPSTIMKQMKDMMKNNEVNEILVNGRQTFMLMKEVKDELHKM
jgi:predicted HTH transcriptional regulator